MSFDHHLSLKKKDSLGSFGIGIAIDKVVLKSNFNMGLFFVLISENFSGIHLQMTEKVVKI